MHSRLSGKNSFNDNEKLGLISDFLKLCDGTPNCPNGDDESYECKCHKKGQVSLLNLTVTGKVDMIFTHFKKYFFTDVVQNGGIYLLFKIITLQWKTSILKLS